MKTILSLFLCLLAPSVFATPTQWYVSSAGSGAADGSSEAAAMSYATFVDYMSAGGSFTATNDSVFNIIQGGGAIARTTTADTFSVGGTVTAPIVIRGYKTTIGDAYIGRTNLTFDLIPDNQTLVTTTTATLTISGNFINFEGMHFSGAKNGSAVTVTGLDCKFVGCTIDDNSTGASACALTLTGARSSAYDCDIRLLAASGGLQALIENGANVKAVNCRISGKTGNGVSLAQTTALYDCLVFASSNGVQCTGGSVGYVLIGNTISGSLSNGVLMALGLTTTFDVWGNIITDSGAYGIEMLADTNSIFKGFNRFRDNVAGDIHFATDSSVLTSYKEITTDTGGPETDFVNSAIADYRLISTSPAMFKGPFGYPIGAFKVTNSTTTTVIGSYTFSQ